MGARITILDDDRRSLERIKFLLQDWDYAVQVFGNPDEALEMLHRESADLVICEVALPGRDGFEVMAELKSDEVTARIPVLLVSSQVSIPDDFIDSFQGRVRYVQKPIVSDDLKSAVAELTS